MTAAAVLCEIPGARSLRSATAPRRRCWSASIPQALGVFTRPEDRQPLGPRVPPTAGSRARRGLTSVAPGPNPGQSSPLPDTRPPLDGYTGLACWAKATRARYMNRNGASWRSLARTFCSNASTPSWHRGHRPPGRRQPRPLRLRSARFLRARARAIAPPRFWLRSSLLHRSLAGPDGGSGGSQEPGCDEPRPRSMGAGPHPVDEPDISTRRPPCSPKLGRRLRHCPLSTSISVQAPIPDRRLYG